MPGLARQQRLDLLQCVGRSELWLLQGRLDILVYDQMFADLCAGVARHDGHCVRRHSPRGPNHVVDQRQAARRDAAPSAGVDFIRVPCPAARMTTCVTFEPIGCVGFAQGSDMAGLSGSPLRAPRTDCGDARIGPHELPRASLACLMLSLGPLERRIDGAAGQAQLGGHLDQTSRRRPRAGGPKPPDILPARPRRTPRASDALRRTGRRHDHCELALAPDRPPYLGH